MTLILLYKYQTLLCTLISLSCLFDYAICQTPPKFHQTRYYPECWIGERYISNYLSDVMPDTGLFAIAGISYNEPSFGYPMHSGIVKGVSDTVMLVVEILNRSTEPFDISSYQADNWFIPVVYDVNLDPRKSNPIADTSGFGYSFEFWFDWYQRIVSQPEAIPYSGDGNLKYYLVYYVWGLPFTDRVRLMMQKTNNAPPGFKLLIRQSSSLWIVKPVDLADTINAFAHCFHRARGFQRNLSAALAWTDSILALNPSSIVGYSLRSSVYSALKDSLSVVTAYDSTIAILERYGDPVLPDSADMNYYQNLWYDDLIKSTKFKRWNRITGTRGLYR
ncbi:MAG: hypothetical protein P9X24_18220 [Candidatus Hatepunaea meridiana]|nr:hypothetical protein [Candidatus Hatepunaea meridiana]